MTGNYPTGHDGYCRSYDEFNLSQPYETSYSGAASTTGDVDVDPVSWDTHSIPVDGLFQRQHHDSSTPLSSGCDSVFPGPVVPFDGWVNDEMSFNLFAAGGLPDSSAYPPDGILPPAGGSASITLATGLAQPAASFINMGAQSATVPAIFPPTCNEVDEETLLKSLRDAGHGFPAISKIMREQLGIEITANALVKRYQKMPKTCESVSGLPPNSDIQNRWMTPC